MTCSFEPDDKRFDDAEEATCPAWVRDAMGSMPVEGGPPRVFLGETEGVEICGIVDFFERERLTDEAEREATERYRGNSLEEAARCRHEQSESPWGSKKTASGKSMSITTLRIEVRTRTTCTRRTYRCRSGAF